jgi:protoporphyrinogen oxidase
MTDEVETLIVGAGPTGLGAAWRLASREKTDWLVCESEASCGGLASSVVDEHGFTWDLGGHVQFSHYDYFDDLMDDLLGREGWIYHERSSWVRICGSFVPYPFQLNLRYLPQRERWDAVQGLLRLSHDGTTAPAHFGAWVDRTFGEGIARLFMRPYNFKVWAYPLEELSSTWVGDRVATIDVERAIRNVLLEQDDVSWGPNNKFRFPLRGGTGGIWRALGEKLSTRILLKTRLVELDTTNHIARFSTGLSVRFQRLLSTLALDQLVSLSDLSRDLGFAARELRYSSTHIVGVGLHGEPPERLRGKCWMYFPESDCPFYRVTVFSHYSPNNVPDPRCYWSLMAEVSESPRKPVDARNVVAETIEGLLNVGLVERRELVHHSWYQRLERGYPTPSLGRDDALATIQTVFDERNVLSRGRFGAWKYEVSNQDHSFAQGVEAVDRWLDGVHEKTINHPEIVNARKS